MSTPPTRQARKRLATRQAISDIATRLFFERGFDRVTVDEIAMAADVGRMTVFNHFPRKEDMVFDRDHEIREALRGAVRAHEPGTGPIEMLRLLAHRAIAGDHPYVGFSEGSRRFVETVMASEALKARARAIRDEVARCLAADLAERVNRPEGDLDADLVANLQLATWTVAFVQAYELYRRGGDGEAAKALFLSVIDKGARGLAASVMGSPYTRSPG